MAYAVARRARGFAPAADPNVIPFIDVLLVLLIIFMVTAPKPTTDLRVDLTPRSVGAPVIIPPTIVEIRPTATGVGFFVGGEEIAREALAERTLAHMLGANPVITAADARAEGRIFVRADLDVAYNEVVSVVDDLQLARFRKIAIAAQNANAP